MNSLLLSTLSPKGQVTIPKVLRERLRLRSGEVVLMEEASDGIVLKKARVTSASDEFTEDEWKTLKKMSQKKGRRYPTQKAFLDSLK